MCSQAFSNFSYIKPEPAESRLLFFDSHGSREDNGKPTVIAMSDTPKLKQNNADEPEIISPGKRVRPAILNDPEVRTKLRGLGFGISVAPFFGLALWALNEFLSLRGVVHMGASRIVLGVLLASGVACILAGMEAAAIFWGIRSSTKKASVVGLIVFLVGTVVFLDWWAPRPQLTNIPPHIAYVRPADWRTIQDWQKAELVPLLERYPNYTLHILASAVSDESLDYANQFKELFAAHKWKVIGPETVADQIALNMQLSISDQYWGKPRPEAFTALDSALQFIHIKTSRNFVVDPLARPDELVMWIGPQTPPDYPQHSPLQLSNVCRSSLQFTDDTMHFIPGDGRDFVRWVRIKPATGTAKFVAGQRLFVFLTGPARSVANSEYFRVQALGAPMPRPDVLDITTTKDLKVGEKVDLKIISDAELRVRCVDNRL
jgi:hypothetical protein